MNFPNASSIEGNLPDPDEPTIPTRNDLFFVWRLIKLYIDSVWYTFNFPPGNTFSLKFALSLYPTSSLTTIPCSYREYLRASQSATYVYDMCFLCPDRPYAQIRARLTVVNHYFPGQAYPFPILSSLFRCSFFDC